MAEGECINKRFLVFFFSPQDGRYGIILLERDTGDERWWEIANVLQ